uniref:RRM domain-containing protein n=1 Tax=Alexandrium catenella TaxID=2925 RepID=A0A7S1LGI4_ALECA
MDSSDDFEFQPYEPGCFLRQLSEPAKLSSAPAAPIALPPGIRVKNTFLDFGDFEIDETRWSAAKPAKIQVHQHDGGQATCFAQSADHLRKRYMSEGDASTNGSELSNQATSSAMSAPDSDSPMSKTPESGSPRMDPPMQATPAGHAPASCMSSVCGQGEVPSNFPSQAAHILTVHGLPQDYTTALFQKEVCDAGFRAETDFDFLFVPRDPNTGVCLGCAFVNMRSARAMRSFTAAFQGRSLRYVGPCWDKVLSVTISSFQDLIHVLGHRGTQAAAATARPRFCTSCGTSFEGRSFNFCPRCGTPVSRS